MMMISTRGRYALRVMAELALHDLDAYVPLKEIAQRQGISEKYLEAIIKLLVKERFVVGLRGKGGGYRLARHPGTYTAESILLVAEGSLAPVACLEQGGSQCPRAAQCVTLPMWRDFYDLIHNFFSGITLEDLAKQSPR